MQLSLRYVLYVLFNAEMQHILVNFLKYIYRVVQNSKRYCTYSFGKRTQI